MAHEDRRRLRRPVEAVASLSGVALDAVVVGIIGWIVLWVMLDFHSHIGGLDFTEEGFLTPEHTMFYGGFLALFAVVGLVSLRRYRSGHGLRTAAPPGYRLGLLGLLVFAVGGPLDAVWHGIFGAEADVEALVSPTHLLLATGGVLFGSAPLRAAWHHRDADGLRQVPAVVAATATLTMLTAFTIYLQPAFVVPGQGEAGYGLASVLAASALGAGGVATLLRFRPVPGACTVLLAVPGAAMAFLAQQWWTIVPYVLAGIAADAFVQVGAPRESAGWFYGTIAAVPAILVAVFLLALGAVGGSTWSTHLLTGSVYLGACVGLLVAFLARRPTGRTSDTSSARSESL